MDHIQHYDSPFGEITIASDGEALTGLWFESQRYFADTLSDLYTERESLPVFEQTVRWLDLYFKGRDPGFTPPLKMEASPFRMTVWEILLTIPYGQTMSYGEIAAVIAERRKQDLLAAGQGSVMNSVRMSAQAVGGAVGHNPISLIVPCHRVIGSDGSLTGYGGGLELKRKLLELEGWGRQGTVPCLR